MAKHSSNFDFKAVLAVTIHDMKNALQALLRCTETLSDILPAGTQEAEQMAVIHANGMRLNTGITHLLSLSRVELDQLPLNPQECLVADLITDLLVANKHYIRPKAIRLIVPQPPNLSCYLDSDLINIVLDDVLANAMRYGRHVIRMARSEDSHYFALTSEDDGPGYPQSMLSNKGTDVGEFDIATGRAGLGLFFAKMIAATHIDGDRSGSVHLCNGGSLGGEVFTMRLPRC